MPPSKRRQMMAAVPGTRDAIAYLRNTGQPQLADDVATVLDYATAFGQPSPQPGAGRSGTAPNYSLHIEKTFRDHLRAVGADAAGVVDDALERFRTGQWTPPRPQRAPHGSTPAKTSLNVRVDQELWEAVDALAKDPQASEERGFALNARQVAIAALYEAYPMPEQETAG